MTIHGTDPFVTPEGERSPVRRLRGRLPAPVTLWTAQAPAEALPAAEAVVVGPAGPAGLTVSSVLVADGEPARLLGLVDDESDFWAVVRIAGRFAVSVLGPAHRQLADRFAGVLPAPGGPFRGHEWRPTEYGPVPMDAAAWAGCRLDTSRRFGWGLLVEATIEQAEAGPAGTGFLVHYRGRYHDPT